jgi:hypothetical protein
MTLNRFLLAASALLALVLAGCGGSSPSETVYCPQPFTVQDASRITHFKAGPGRDPRDVEFEAELVSAGASCELNRNQMNVTLIMRVAANAGPSIGGNITRVPYFVRVIDSTGRVVQGQDFTADFKLSSANPRAQSQEELALTLPYSQVSDLARYRIAVGLKPSREELDYNRRAGARQ